MMPELTPWPEYGQNCPACVNRLSSMGETGLYEWDPTDPDKLLCKYCKTEYPNASYPETGSITAPRMNQTFTFYLTDEERRPPRRQIRQTRLQVGQLAPYTRVGPASSAQKKAAGASNISCRLPNYTPSTDDVLYARWCAYIMDCMARRYPNWPLPLLRRHHSGLPTGRSRHLPGQISPRRAFSRRNHHHRL